MKCQPLNISQAEAIYSAMRALNKVGAVIKATLYETGEKVIRVEDCGDGAIIVTEGFRTVARYSDQSAFATAYGLQQG